MRFHVIPVTPFQQNCSLLWCEETGQAALIDPGGEADRLLAAVGERGLTLTRLILTHGHLDHAGAAAEVAQQLGIPVEGPHREDAFWLQSLPQQAQMFGLPHAEPLVPDRWLDEGDRVAVGRVVLEVIHCPGHTPGHLVFFERESRTAFVGDVLFKGSVGRTDLPGGDHDALLSCIRGKLFPLGDDIRFIPGHGAMSTFGEERRDNPFVGEGT